MLLKTTALLFTFLLVSCAEDSLKLVPMPDPAEKLEENLGDVSFNIKPKVDILFVVDDSGSMNTHQKNLASNIALFTSGIIKNIILDYHIGVITTDMDFQSGILRGNTKYVSRQTPNGMSELANNLLVGTNGGYIESVFDPLRKALTQPLVNGVNNGFYRDDAYLVLVFITDAVDQSIFSADDMKRFLVGLKKGDPNKVLAYGSIVPTLSSGNCSRDGGSSQTPIKIEKFIQSLSGSYFSLCDPDFGSKLANIGQDLVDKIEFFTPLKVYPDVHTIEVKYGDYVVPNHPYKGWSYDPRRVGVRIGKEIEIPDKYQVKGAELKISFTPAKID